MSPEDGIFERQGQTQIFFVGPLDSPPGGVFVGGKGRASRAAPRRIASLALSDEPRLQRHLRSRRVLAPEELKAFPTREADAAPAPDQRMLRKQRRLDGKGRDRARRSGRRRRVRGQCAARGTRLREHSPCRNPKPPFLLRPTQSLKSVMPIQFRELINATAIPLRDGPGPSAEGHPQRGIGDHNAPWAPR